MAKEPKEPKTEIVVDILDMELTQGLPHWLHPSQRNPRKEKSKPRAETPDKPKRKGD